MISKKIFTPAYFGPVQWYAHFCQGKAIVENHSNYIRQTYRNRCVIVGANGPLMLSVPIEKGRSHNMPFRDVRIAYHTSWQRQHWNSIVSAYNSSPFFEFYRDDIEPFFKQPYTFLFDFNIQITSCILELTDIDQELIFTDIFMHHVSSDTLDLRETIHPKTGYREGDTLFSPVAYSQVFDQRHGFVPNLSILDLLFNKGPETILILEQSIREG